MACAVRVQFLSENDAKCNPNDTEIHVIILRCFNLLADADADSENPYSERQVLFAPGCLVAKPN